MRKKLALLLAGVMVAAVVPFSTAMAGTTNYADSTPTVQKGDKTSNYLVIKDANKDIETKTKVEDVVFTMELDGAEWDGMLPTVNCGADALTIEVVDKTLVKVTIPKVTTGALGEGGYFRIPMKTVIKNKGDITVTVDGKGGVVSSGTYTYAVCIAGSATAKIKDKVNITDSSSTTIKNITISETAPGALNSGEIKLKLSKSFKFVSPGAVKEVIKDTGAGKISIKSVSDNEILLNVTASDNKAMEYLLEGIAIAPTKKAKVGDVAEITVTGAGMTKVTLEAGTFVDYGVKVAIFDEEEDVPVFAAGKVYSSKDDVTVAVQISETVADSMNTNRKVTFKFPEGIKVVNGQVKDGGSWVLPDGDYWGVYFKDNTDSDAWANIDLSKLDVEIDENEVTIKGFDKIKAEDKIKMNFAFNLAISPEFTGDVDVTVGGTAIDVEETLTVAEVKAPYTVEAKVNEVAIDYRNVAVTDIVIKEAAEGTFKEDEVIKLQVENMHFEKGMEYEVTAGDLEVKSPLNVKTDGTIEITIKEESAKTAGEITLSNIQLYLGRALPAGDYDLIALADGKLYASCDDTLARNDKGEAYFDIDDVTMVKGYVRVITAGRDVDDSTFTTKIVVPVGEKTIKAGEKEIAIDVPAFINADGYTMMPLRAVVEALSGTAIVTWDGDTKTATVLFGARVISMTIGQKHMVINGVSVAMLAAPVIVESRTFLPLRDLGYALGLNESQVNWDSATKTATLN